MFSDPIFLLALTGVGILLIIWIIEAIKMDSHTEDELQTPNQGIISKIGFALGLIILYRIFVNAGDLSIILLIGTVISLLIWLTGKFINNKFLGSTGRSWFLPIFAIFILRTFLYEPYQIPSGSMIPGSGLVVQSI